MFPRGEARPLKRIEKVAARFQLASDQVGDDLGIGFALEHEALRLELSAQPGVVLDHAVVHHGHGGGARAAAECG